MLKVSSTSKRENQTGALAWCLAVALFGPGTSAAQAQRARSSVPAPLLAFVSEEGVLMDDVAFQLWLDGSFDPSIAPRGTETQILACLPSGAALECRIEAQQVVALRNPEGVCIVDQWSRRLTMRWQAGAGIWRAVLPGSPESENEGWTHVVTLRPLAGSRWSLREEWIPIPGVCEEPAAPRGQENRRCSRVVMDYRQQDDFEVTPAGTVPTVLSSTPIPTACRAVQFRIQDSGSFTHPVTARAHCGG